MDRWIVEWAGASDVGTQARTGCDVANGWYVASFPPAGADAAILKAAEEAIPKAERITDE